MANDGPNQQMEHLENIWWMVKRKFNYQFLLIKTLILTPYLENYLSNTSIITEPA